MLKLVRGECFGLRDGLSGLKIVHFDGYVVAEDDLATLMNQIILSALR